MKRGPKQKTHCANNHRLDESNVRYVTQRKNGRTYRVRLCLGCQRLSDRTRSRK